MKNNINNQIKYNVFEHQVQSAIILAGFKKLLGSVISGGTGKFQKIMIFEEKLDI